MNSIEYRYKAKVDRWIDGDTVDLHVDLGFYTSITTRFRLYGVDTPERGNMLWVEASSFSSRMAPAGTEVFIEVFKTADKYGRWLAKVSVGEQSVNDSLIAAGLAVPYFGGTKIG